MIGDAVRQELAAVIYVWFSKFNKQQFFSLRIKKMDSLFAFSDFSSYEECKFIFSNTLWIFAFFLPSNLCKINLNHIFLDALCVIVIIVHYLASRSYTLGFQDTNVLGFKGPRKMTVLIPGICDTENYRRKEIRPVLVKNFNFLGISKFIKIWFCLLKLRGLLKRQ